MIVRYSALLGPCFPVAVTAEYHAAEPEVNYPESLDLIAVLGEDWEEIESGDDILPYLNEKAINELIGQFQP